MICRLCRFICNFLRVLWASLVAQMVKNLPAMQETWVQSLGQEDSLEKEMATHSSILAWRIPWTEESGGSIVLGSQWVGQNWATNTSLYWYLSTIYLNFLQKILSILLKKKNSSSCLSLWYSISLESAIFLLLYWFLPFDMGERNFSFHFFESKWKTVRLGQNSLTNNVVCCWLLEGKRKLVIISSPYHTPINQLRWLCVLFTCPLTIACSHAM